MMNTMTRIGVLACLVAALPHAALAQSKKHEGRTVTGKIVSLSVDDPTDTKGLTAVERRYVVRVRIDSVGNTVLGFGERGKDFGPQRAMFDLLVKAMENDWPVSLRLARVVSGSGKQPAYSSVVSVSVKP